jgi:hypothetical protein
VIGGGYILSNYQPGFFTAGGAHYRTYQETAAAIVQSLAPGETFAFVLINENGDLLGENYRYFFDYYATPEQLLSNEQILAADNLFVIDETRAIALFGHESYELVVYRNLPNVSYSVFLDQETGPLIYRFAKERVSL